MTTPLREAWATVRSRLKLLEPMPFSDGEWSVLERLHARFNDREAHTRLPLAIARFRAEAVEEIRRRTREAIAGQRWLGAMLLLFLYRRFRTTT